MSNYDPLSQADSDEQRGSGSLWIQDRQAIQFIPSRHAGVVRLLAGANAHRPLSARRVPGTPERLYPQPSPTLSGTTVGLAAIHSQSSAPGYHGVRLLKARPVSATAHTQHCDSTKHASSTLPRGSPRRPLDPRLLKLPVQQQPHTQASSSTNNTSERDAQLVPSAGSVLARSLRTAATAAAQVLEIFINDPHGCADNYYYDALPHQTNSDAGNTSTSHTASAQPVRGQGMGDGLGQQKRKVLRPSMANRLVELTTLQASQTPCTSHTAAGKPAESMWEHPATGQTHGHVAKTSAAQLPIDMLMPIRIRPSTSAVQIASQVTCIGDSSAAGLHREPGSSPTGSRQTSASTVVSYSAHRSIHANPHQHNSAEAAAAHLPTLSASGEVAGTPKALMDVLHSSSAAPACISASHTQNYSRRTPVTGRQAATADATGPAAQQMKTLTLCHLTVGTARVVEPSSSVLSDGAAREVLCKPAGPVDGKGALIHSRGRSSNGHLQLTELCSRSEAGGTSNNIDTAAGQLYAGAGEAPAADTTPALSASLLSGEHAYSCMVDAGECVHTEALQQTGDEILGREDLQCDHEDTGPAASCPVCSVPHEVVTASGPCVSVRRDEGRKASILVEGEVEAESCVVSSTGFLGCTQPKTSRGNALAGLAISPKHSFATDAGRDFTPAPEAHASLSEPPGHTRAVQGDPIDVSTEPSDISRAEEVPEPLLCDGQEDLAEQERCDTDSDQKPLLGNSVKMDASAAELVAGTNVYSSPRIQAVAQTGPRSAGQSPVQRTEALQLPISPRGLLELQDKIEQKAQHILNATADEPERVTRESKDFEKSMPFIFEQLHAWLLQPGTAEEVYAGAVTIGAGTLAKCMYQATFGTLITQLEYGYLTASLVAGSIMVDGIPTLFGDADDVELSLPELQAAVDDCARAGHSNPMVFKEIQLAVHASAWAGKQLEPIVAFNAIDWEGKGHITMMQLCHLLVTWHNFDSSKNIRKSALSLRRVLAAGFQHAYLRDRNTERFTWEQVCRLLGVQQADSNLIAEAKQAGRSWAEGTASSALDKLRHAHAGPKTCGAKDS